MLPVCEQRRLPRLLLECRSAGLSCRFRRHRLPLTPRLPLLWNACLSGGSSRREGEERGGEREGGKEDGRAHPQPQSVRRQLRLLRPRRFWGRDAEERRSRPHESGAGMLRRGGVAGTWRRMTMRRGRDQAGSRDGGTLLSVQPAPSEEEMAQSVPHAGYSHRRCGSLTQGSRRLSTASRLRCHFSFQGRSTQF